MVYVSQKAFCSSFLAPTFLWNGIFKIKPFLKAVTIFSFTSLHFSWGRETLAKSWILSVKIIILAYSLLSFFSYRRNSGRPMQSKWIVLPVLFQTAFPRHTSIFNHQLSTQLSHSENVAVFNCAIRHGSIIYDMMPTVVGSCTIHSLSRAYKSSSVTIHMRGWPSADGEKQSRLFCDNLRKVISSDCQCSQWGWVIVLGFGAICWVCCISFVISI